MNEEEIKTLKEMVENEFCHFDVGECTNSGMLEFICTHVYKLGYSDGYIEGYGYGLQDGGQ